MGFNSGFKELRISVATPPLPPTCPHCWHSTTSLYPHTVLPAEHATQRLVRSWLQPATLNIKAQLRLEVLEQEVMTVPVDIALGHWYHFCQSWSNTAGQWELHANGKLTAAGDSWKVSGLRYVQRHGRVYEDSVF